MYHANMLDLRK